MTQLSFFEPAPDVREVHNYVQALDFGLKRLDRLPLSLRLIRELHARLMEGVRGEHMTPGEFRRTQNWIGPSGSTINNAAYVPPPSEEMNLTLAQMEQFIHQPSELPGLVRIGMIHYQFEAIHPFLDGNGRVGRLLVSLLLCAWDLLPQPVLYLSAFFEANRLEYYDRLLAVSQRGEWENWLIFFLMGISSQAQDAMLRIQKIEGLRQSYRQRLEGEQTANALLQLLDVLFERPILNIQQVANALKVAYPTAHRYMNRMAALSIVREVTGYRRNRIYRADAILEAIEAPLESPNIQ